MRWPCLLLAAVMLLTIEASGQSMRRFEPIPTPEAVPDGQEAVENVAPLDQGAARRAVGQVVEAWNNGQLGDYIGEDFPDRQRLLDSMDEDVPDDARIRVLGVRSIQTVQQFLGETPDGAGQITSIVAVTADTQIEFNDPARGLRLLRGQNELIMRVTEQVVRQ